MEQTFALPLGETGRLVEGGPVMTVEAYVDHLLLCVWLDETGRVRRQTFAPNQIVLHHVPHLTWFRVLVRLAPKWRVVAATA